MTYYGNGPEAREADRYWPGPEDREETHRETRRLLRRAYVVRGRLLADVTAITVLVLEDATGGPVRYGETAAGVACGVDLARAALRWAARHPRVGPPVTAAARAIIDAHEARLAEMRRRT